MHNISCPIKSGEEKEIEKTPSNWFLKLALLSVRLQACDCVKEKKYYVQIKLTKKIDK